MASNVKNNNADVHDNAEEINKLIRELPIKEKIKAVALNHYLQKKKRFDRELEKDLKILQKKFETLTAPLYRKGNEIIEGYRLPTEDELKELDNFLNEEEITTKQQAMVSDPIVGYWARALKNCDIIAQEIKDKDEVVLRNLTKIEYLPAEQGDDFSLVFTFEHNDFFTNSTLKKSFVMKNGENPVKSEGTIIEWKEGKNVTKKTVKKKLKDKRIGKHTMITQEVDAESFFNFFKGINLEDREAIEKLDPGDMDKLAERMDIDYDIARMIIDEIIPYSLEYYLGVKVNDEYDDIEELQGETSEEEDEESDNDEDLDDSKTKKDRKRKKPSKN